MTGAPQKHTPMSECCRWSLTSLNTWSQCGRPSHTQIFCRRLRGDSSVTFLPFSFMAATWVLEDTSGLHIMRYSSSALKEGDTSSDDALNTFFARCRSATLMGSLATPVM